MIHDFLEISRYLDIKMFRMLLPYMVYTSVEDPPLGYRRRNCQKTPAVWPATKTMTHSRRGRGRGVYANVDQSPLSRRGHVTPLDQWGPNDVELSFSYYLCVYIDTSPSSRSVHERAVLALYIADSCVGVNNSSIILL